MIQVECSRKTNMGVIAMLKIIANMFLNRFQLGQNTLKVDENIALESTQNVMNQFI